MYLALFFKVGLTVLEPLHELFQGTFYVVRVAQVDIVAIVFDLYHMLGCIVLVQLHDQASSVPRRLHTV